MWLLIELLIIPVLLIVWIVVAGVVEQFGLGTVVLGAFLITMLATVTGSLLRYLWQLEMEEHVHDTTIGHEVSASEALAAEALAAELPPTPAELTAEASARERAAEAETWPGPIESGQGPHLPTSP